MQIVTDNGISYVCEMDGPKKFKVGNRQGVGKQKVMHHDRAAEASAAAQTAGRDISALRGALADQGGAQAVKERVERALKRREPGAHADRGMSPPGGAEDDDDVAMGFSSLSRIVPSRVGPAATAARRRPSLESLADIRSEAGEETEGLESLASQSLGGSELTEEESATPSSGRGRRARGSSRNANPSQDGKLTAKTKTLWNGKKTAFSDMALWEGKLKQRSVESMATQLENSYQKVLASQEPGREDLAKDISAFIGNVRAKFNLFTEIRDGPTDWVMKAPEPEALDLLRRLPASMLATIFTFCAKEMMKHVEQECREPRSGYVISGCYRQLINKQ